MKTVDTTTHSSNQTKCNYSVPKKKVQCYSIPQTKLSDDRLPGWLLPYPQPAKALQTCIKVYIKYEYMQQYFLEIVKILCPKNLDNLQK